MPLFYTVTPEKHGKLAQKDKSFPVGYKSELNQHSPDRKTDRY